MPTSNDIGVREARKEDMPQVSELIKELAKFENSENQCKLTPEILIKDGFETTTPIFKCFVAHVDNLIVGYAISFISYSTWKGKSILLEDLFVLPQYRKLGLGKKLFKCVAKDAILSDCKRIDLHCLSFNPALEFYKKLGVKNLTQSEHWHDLRMHEDELNKLIKS